MEPVLNELSIVPEESPSHSLLDARMAGLIALLKELHTLGAPRALRCTNDSLARVIGGGLTLGAWLAKRDHLREEKLFLRMALQKAPHIGDLIEQRELEGDATFEFKVNGELALGAGWAWLSESLLVSLGDSHLWAKPHVKVDIFSISSAIGEATRSESVPHASQKAHLAKHSSWIQHACETAKLRRVAGLSCGREVWARREEIFPNLLFVETLEAQLSAFHGAEPFFRTVLKHLAAINEAALAWTTGQFSPGIDWSSESNSTMSQPSYAQARTFTCPDGVERTFTSHTKLRAGNLRIYFHAEKPGSPVIVGYCGRHLPTTMYPT